MRLILMVISLTISALAFVYKEKQIDQMAQWFGQGSSTPGPSFATAPTSGGGDLLDELWAKATGSIASGQTGSVPVDAGGMVQATAPRTSGSMAEDIASSGFSSEIYSEIEASIAGASMGGPSRPLTPAMKGSKGARFVKVEPSR